MNCDHMVFIMAGCNEGAGIPADVFFIPCYIILVALSLYGPIEYAYMSRLCMKDFIHVLICLFLNLVFLGCIVFGWLYMLDRTRIKDVSRLASSIVPLLLFLGCYVVGIRIIDLENIEIIKIPNIAPWLFTWEKCRNYLFIDPYHLVLFGIGFLCLIVAFAAPIGFSYGVKAFITALVAYFGALIIGLTYQDWFWFVWSPVSSLTCGSRYGVFFNQWICWGYIEIPTMYVIAHFVGIPLIIIPSQRICRGKITICVTTLLLLLLILITIGIIYILFLKVK